MHSTIFAAALVLLLLPGSPALPEEFSGPEISYPAIKEYLDTGKRSPGLLEEIKRIKENKSRSSPEYKALDGLLNRSGQKGRFQFVELLQREGLHGSTSPEVLPAIGRVRIHSVEVVDRRTATDEPSNREPPSQQLKVSFGVEGDLFSYLKYHEHNLGVEFGFCTPEFMYGGRNARNLDKNPYVYDDNGMVNSFRKDIAGGARQPPDRIFRVYAYMQGKEERRGA